MCGCVQAQHLVFAQLPAKYSDGARLQVLDVGRGARGGSSKGWQSVEVVVGRRPGDAEAAIVAASIEQAEEVCDFDSNGVETVLLTLNEPFGARMLFPKRGLSQAIPTVALMQLRHLCRGDVFDEGSEQFLEINITAIRRCNTS